MELELVIKSPTMNATIAKPTITKRRMEWFLMRCNTAICFNVFCYNYFSNSDHFFVKVGKIGREYT